MMRKTLLIALVGGGLAAFGILMYLIGWHSGVTAAAASVPPVPSVKVSTQVPPTLQELIPLAPNRQERGQGQNQNCTPVVLFYYQGRLYQLQLGPEGHQGTPTSPPEFFPLQPYQGPQIPGLPFTPAPPGGAPNSPGFRPVNPRF